MNRRQAKNLFKAVQALRESPAPKDFRMKCFVNACGTPACVLGHIGSRTDLQRMFKFVRERLPHSSEEFWKGVFARGEDYADDAQYKPGPDGTLYHFSLQTRKDNYGVGYDSPEILEFFGVDDDEARDLFGTAGCDNAQTPKEAIRYIQRFIVRKVGPYLKSEGIRPSVKAARAWAGAA